MKNCIHKQGHFATGKIFTPLRCTFAEILGKLSLKLEDDKIIETSKNESVSMESHK